MTDPIKPATRKDVEYWKGWPTPEVDFFEEEKQLIATLESWEPVMRSLASVDCFWGADPKGSPDCECISCTAAKLMEQWNG